VIQSPSESVAEHLVIINQQDSWSTHRLRLRHHNPIDDMGGTRTR
jgi:hypothetical protein